MAPDDVAGTPVSQRFLARPSVEVAPDLLGLILAVGPRAGRIVEVEAYAGSQDPGSHAFRGLTRRNAMLFGRPGQLYVYFTYGMHWCSNVVTDREGVAGAVLIRALAPLSGLEEMRLARPAARAERDLCSGPAKLTQALGIDGAFDGVDLLSGQDGAALLDDGMTLPSPPTVTTRIGLSAGVDLPWRWFVPGDPNVSRGPRAKPTLS